MTHNPSMTMLYEQLGLDFRVDGQDFQIAGDKVSLSHEAFSRAFRNACSRLAARLADDAGKRFDSASTLIAARDLEQVMAEALRDVFGPRYGERYVPTGSYGVMPWMTSYIQKRITRKGLLDYVTSASM